MCNGGRRGMEYVPVHDFNNDSRHANRGLHVLPTQRAFWRYGDYVASNADRHDQWNGRRNESRYAVSISFRGRCYGRYLRPDLHTANLAD